MYRLSILVMALLVSTNSLVAIDTARRTNNLVANDMAGKCFLNDSINPTRTSFIKLYKISVFVLLNSG